MTGCGTPILLFGDAIGVLGPSSMSVAVGDGGEMLDDARGGDDYLHNKEGGCTLHGDAETMADNATGGDDVLSGSAGGDRTPPDDSHAS